MNIFGAPDAVLGCALRLLKVAWTDGKSSALKVLMMIWADISAHVDSWETITHIVRSGRFLDGFHIRQSTQDRLQAESLKFVGLLAITEEHRDVVFIQLD